MRFSPAHVSERRQWPRHQVNCPGGIDIGDGSPVRACTIWDVSEAGARISTTAPAEVPQEFILAMSDGRVRRQCRVVWRSDEQIAARFLAAPDSNWSA